MSKKFSLKGSVTRSNKKILPETIIYKIFETNSSFYVKYGTALQEEINFFFFNIFLLVLTKVLFRQEDWAPDCHSMNLDTFVIISNFLRF